MTVTESRMKQILKAFEVTDMECTVKSAKAAMDFMRDVVATHPWPGEMKIIIEMEGDKKCSGQQKKSLHVYLRLLANALNDAGWDMKRTLKKEIEIPWTEVSAKEHIWRPIQRIMCEKESTKEPTTKEYQEIYKVVDRHLAEKTGVSVPWPSLETQYQESRK